MPVYDYKCKQCGNTFEKNVPMAEYKCPQECPECGCNAEKQVSCAMLRDVG
jgi:putative FmdB family regulatory protein